MSSRLVPLADTCSVLPATWAPQHLPLSLDAIRGWLEPMCEGHSVDLLLSPQPMLSISGKLLKALPEVMLILCGLVQDGPREQLCSQIWGRSGRGQEPMPCFPTPCLCPSVHPSLPSPSLPASARALRSQGPKPAAPWCTLAPASWPLPLLGDLGSGLLLPGPLPFPPTADVLQTHNTVFQEHAAPSSPGTAPASRGFRRASEISIASQVSGMAESYTASSIAQSECCPLCFCHRYFSWGPWKEGGSGVYLAGSVSSPGRARGLQLQSLISSASLC